jgi:signal transduction histidine kinase
LCTKTILYSTGIKYTICNSPKCLIILAALCFFTFCKAQQKLLLTDSNKQSTYYTDSTKEQLHAAIAAVETAISGIPYNEEKSINKYFFIADNYMDMEQYDSAQLWLNKIHEKLPAKENSLNNYFLISRQAEVYYYNNLQQLGLQESMRGLEMAKSLNDSLLLADSYNFSGLFLLNMDSVENAVNFFLKGIPFAKQPPFPVKYQSLSKPHHLYGNLAEAFFKLKQYKNAAECYTISRQMATAIGASRGIALAYFGLAEVYFNTQKTDSAVSYYSKAISTADIYNTTSDLDVALICFGGLGKCYFENNALPEANKTIKTGLDLLKLNPNLNKFYALIFLNTAYEIFKKQEFVAATIEVLELKMEIEKSNIDGSNKQIQTILKAGVANEKEVLNLQVQDAKRKQELANTRLILALVGFAFAIIAFLVYRYYQKQKIAVYKMRQKISQDLHDDIGSSLSSIQIFSELANIHWDTKPMETKLNVSKIAAISKDLMQQISDIVWSMKPPTEEKNFLTARIKNYAADFLTPLQINCTFNIDERLVQKITNPHIRRSILLIIKEAINNVAKYSKAKNCTISFAEENRFLLLFIKDDGVGFNTTGIKQGNGLYNIQSRCKQLGGNCTINTNPGEGVWVNCYLPATIFSHY